MATVIETEEYTIEQPDGTIVTTTTKMTTEQKTTYEDNSTTDRYHYFLVPRTWIRVLQFVREVEQNALLYLLSSLL